MNIQPFFGTGSSSGNTSIEYWTDDKLIAEFNDAVQRMQLDMKSYTESNEKPQYLTLYSIVEHFLTIPYNTYILMKNSGNEIVNEFDNYTTAYLNNCFTELAVKHKASANYCVWRHKQLGEKDTQHQKLDVTGVNSTTSIPIPNWVDGESSAADAYEKFTNDIEFIEVQENDIPIEPEEPDTSILKGSDEDII